MRRALALSIIAHLLLVGLLTYLMQRPPAGDNATGNRPMEVALQHAGSGRPADASPESVREKKSAAQALTPMPALAQQLAQKPALLLPPATAMPATTGPLSAEAPGAQPVVAALFDTHKRNYLLTLNRHMLSRPPNYPRDAFKRGVEGTVIITFRMDRLGNIISASISASSGDESLDAAALAAVRQRSPVPAPPPDVAVDGIDWDWSVPFRIE